MLVIWCSVGILRWRPCWWRYRMNLKESRTLHAFWVVDESCHNWICDLVNLCIGEWCDYVDWCICTLVNFCWWLWIFELGSNCVSYLLVLIQLVNLFDDNYFGYSDELRIVYVCVCVCVYIYICIWCGDSFDNDNCLLITLKWWIVLVELSMLNEE